MLLNYTGNVLQRIGIDSTIEKAHFILIPIELGRRTGTVQAHARKSQFKLTEWILILAEIIQTHIHYEVP